MKSTGGTETSIEPTKDHVFLTWHNINFTVPQKIDAQKEGLFDIDDKRMSLLKDHGIQSIISKNSDSTHEMKGPAYQSLSPRESTS